MNKREVSTAVGLAMFICLYAFNSARAEWGTYQGNPSHSGYVPGALDIDRLTLRWQTPVDSRTPTGIAVGGGTVFVTNSAYFSSADSLRALDQSSGAVLWSKSYGSQNDTTSAPAFANGAVYVQTDGHSAIAGNFLHAYAARTGSSLFNAPYGAQWETYLNPTPFSGNVYVGGGYYGGIYSFGANNGQQNWFGYVGQYDGWTPAVDNNNCYVFTGSGDTVPIRGEFRIIDRATGSTRYLITDTDYQWNGYTMNSAVVLGPNSDAFSINEAGSVYPDYSSNGRLIKWDLRADSTHTPHIGWVLTDHFTGQPTLANGVLYVNNGGSLAALDEMSGNTLWTWTPPSDMLTGTMISTDNALLLTTKTTTYALDLASHSPIWSYPVSGVLAISDNTLYIAGSDHFVYAIGVPEPSTVALCGAATMGLAVARSWRPKARRNRIRTASL